jgi:RHS repeat-associated protein
VVATYVDDTARARYGTTINSPFRLLGQVADDDAELCFTRFRCFDPEVGSWISSDPLELEGGLNLYGFDGAPTDVVDPLGLATGGGDPHAKASDLPVIKPGSPEWKKQVKDMRSPGGGSDCRVATQADAERLLKEARGGLPRKGSADDPYNHGGEPYKAGYEVHPSEANSANAPQNDLPHVKWKDWSQGKSQGGSGHIFFD